MAGWTGLEPAAFCVTGRRSNQLSYHPKKGKGGETVEFAGAKSSALRTLFFKPLKLPRQHRLPTRCIPS